MVSVSYTDLHTLLDKTIVDLTAAETEALIDLSIDLLNSLGADLNRMGGTSGSKTVSLDTEERGPVLLGARHLYYSVFQEPGSQSTGGLTDSNPDPLANPATLSFFERLARRIVKPSGKTG